MIMDGISVIERRQFYFIAYNGSRLAVRAGIEPQNLNRITNF